MPKEFIDIKGAKVNNLKRIDVKIPRDKMVVMTGLSGSGKSSLAFETIYAEGQRRYVESLSSYARMFLGQMDKPDVESIDGLSPAISIDQKTTSKNPRSTVGTVTEIYDYIRLLYARIGIPHCPVCGREILKQSVDQIVDKILLLEEGTKFLVLAPVVRGKKGRHEKVIDSARKGGFSRAKIDGSIYDLTEEITLDKNIKHNISVVVDRLQIKDGLRSRLSDSLETATSLADGLVVIETTDGNEVMYSMNFACPDHGVSIDELTPRLFSFNNPFGACPTCGGLGHTLELDPDLIIPDKNLSLAEGCIKATSWSFIYGGSIAKMYFEALSKHYTFSLDTPFKDLSKEVQNVILYGSGDVKLEMKRDTSFGSGVYKTAFEGVIPNLQRRYKETSSEFIRREIQLVMSEHHCNDCNGMRLRKEALGVTVGGKNIFELTEMSVVDELEFIGNLSLSEKEQMIAKDILKEIKERLSFLKNVGLDYLTLSRSATTLSGGESQRIRLATQISSSLTGVIYILDEPSIGLHQRDNEKLIHALKELRDLGNSLIIVEHDEDTMRESDYIIDIGPGAGVHGGEIVACGTPDEVAACENSITGQYLSGKKKIPVPQKRREGNGNTLEIVKAHANNLKNISVSIPLGKFTCVTGVSGSGKSSLVNEVLCSYVSQKVNVNSKKFPVNVDRIDGVENIDKIIVIDQSPIGRTPRSNPATYTGVFTEIRNVFASTPDAKMKGFGPGRFSFNVKGGRCEACQGDGIIEYEMHFLPDVYVPCEVCKGKRYNHETLEVKYKGKSISDVLDMTIEEGLEFFKNFPSIERKLKTLYDVGLGYIKIGQPSTTLSGGEAQRVKLATELSKRSTGKTLYVLDEPTTGLHTHDVKRLINILDRFVDAGNSVVVIEHNLDIIKTADHIIDLGPEGGERGGKVVTTGTPEEVAKCKKSYTGQFLKKMLK